MLAGLHIKNMALIREMELELGHGLNILTGETGAGKSIIIGSVNVALGAGNFKDYVSEGCDYALSELAFVTEDDRILEMLKKFDIPEEDGQIVLSRRFQKGRSISRINGETVSLSSIRQIAQRLIDIHGQHEHQSLLNKTFHRELLDKFSGDEMKQLLTLCRDAFYEYNKITEELEQARKDESGRAKEMDFLRFEIGEIDEAGLTSGEDDKLEEEYRKLSHGQKILSSVGAAAGCLDDEDGAADRIGQAVKNLSEVSDLDNEIDDFFNRLCELEESLRETGRSLRYWLDDFQYDEETFARIGKRLDLINHLKSKYGKTIDDILAYQAERMESLDRLENIEIRIKELEKRKQVSYRKLLDLCGKIHRIRETNAPRLSEKIRKSLLDLNFEQVKFEVLIEPLAKPESSGMDEICFMISTNPGQPLKPLKDVASGGELSRIMLAIKAVMASQDEIETLIFDEIDTGISGRTAQRVAEKMAVIASSHQVICITHLPQIAAMADTHMEIRKFVEEGNTITSLRTLEPEESVTELSRMLGGSRITDAVKENAREMKQMADHYKKDLQNAENTE